MNPRALGEPWRVLLADDHEMVREGLAALIQAQRDLVVVAQARSGQEAVLMAERHHPHIAILDLSMPLGGGAEAAERLHGMTPSVRTLVLTRHADPGYLRRVLQAGAGGYVVKRAAIDVLIGAIRTVLEGGTYIDPTLAGTIVSPAVRRVPPDAAAQRHPALSEREAQVLRLIAWGKSNKEAGAALGISMKTAEFYKASGLQKLRLKTRTELLRHALAEGWLDTDGDPE